jgi:hypothetical protein
MLTALEQTREPHSNLEELDELFDRLYLQKGTRKRIQGANHEIMLSNSAAYQESLLAINNFVRDNSNPDQLHVSS